MEYNREILSSIITNYKENFDSINRGEIYKWKAVKCFQNHWDINSENFAEMLNRSLGRAKNLLAAQNFYPKKMICFFAEKAPETVREMFVDLYNENTSVTERIDNFIESSNMLLDTFGEGTWKMHYQTTNSISVYLFFRFPEKYYIFKYQKFKNFAQKIQYSKSPKKGKTEGVQDYFDMCNKILEEIILDENLLEMTKGRLQDEDYSDAAFHLLTEDIVYYGSREIQKNDEWWPREEDYTPGISKEKWLELLNDSSVFNQDSLIIMKRMLDYGGEATCTQLSEKYGGTKNFYNTGSSRLSRRVWERTNCRVPSENNKNSKWWPILYRGKYADNNQSGLYIWKLRPELKEALERYDLTNAPLYQEDANDQEVNYWWLNSNPKIWDLSIMQVGEEFGYSLINENGNKRRIYQNFLEAKEGDLIIGYQSTPIKQVIALCKISRTNDGDSLYFEKIENLLSPIEYSILKEMAELQDMEYFKNPQGSFFRLTKNEYDLIMDVVREHNPIVKRESIQNYSKEDFIADVYMDREQYDILLSLLEHKKNIILQGPPGVGKTYAAKRLAYSIIGKIDEEKVKVIQFHQSYSYEDFIIGYKPYEDGFKLETGIFYRLCKMAENNLDEKFFLIIDEINRGNMSKIFGELLMLIEKDYRGEKITLAYNGKPFMVPKNLYIIGTMNTADRSLAMIDYALRRRFSFYDMVPGFYSQGFKDYQKRLNSDTLNELVDLIQRLNREIANDDSLGEGFCIGHSYFCGQKTGNDEWILQVIEYELIPMLKEYWFDDKTKVKNWEIRLRGVLNE